MTEYLWAVPISDAAPHRAHLLRADQARVTHRLCRPDSQVTVGFATPVSSIYYRPKCKICLRLARKDAVIVKHVPGITSNAYFAYTKHRHHATLNDRGKL